MGDPIKILDLAKTMISIYDLNDKIEIKKRGKVTQSRIYYLRKV